MLRIPWFEMRAATVILPGKIPRWLSMRRRGKPCVWWPIVIIAKPAGDASLIEKERRIKHTDVIKKLKRKN